LQGGGGSAASVEFAAINCVSEHRVCNEWFGIRAYPTFLAVNDKHGTRQEYSGNKDSAEDLVAWATAVGKEWRWLFRRSRLVTFASPDHFLAAVADVPGALTSNQVKAPSAKVRGLEDAAWAAAEASGGGLIGGGAFWVIMFSDGVDCQPCKTAKTNLMRVAAGLHGLPARVGVVDCTEDANAAWCYGSGACLDTAPGGSGGDSSGGGGFDGALGGRLYRDPLALARGSLPCQALPSRPHAPVLKSFAAPPHPWGAAAAAAAAASSEDAEGYPTAAADQQKQQLRRHGSAAAAAVALAGGLKGEALYNENEVESHLALQVVEKVARSALTARFAHHVHAAAAEAMAARDAAESGGGGGGGYERDPFEDEDGGYGGDDDDLGSGGGGGGGCGGDARPEMLWNGPPPKARVAWGGGGGGGVSARPAIGR